MKSRFIILALFCAAVLGLSQTAFGQKTGGQTELSTTQRLDVMSSKLDLMRRSLQAAINAISGDSKEKKTNADERIAERELAIARSSQYDPVMNTTASPYSLP